MTIDVGTKIRALRKKMDLNISNLADLSGISSSMISQIENGKVVPTVVVMWKISKALDVSVGYFFDEETNYQKNPVVRKDERKTILLGKSTRLYEMLVPDQNRIIEFLKITIKEDDISSSGLVTHEGEECGYVMKGRMKIQLGEEEYILEEGDSISFDSTIPHRYDNAGKGECISIWAMTPPSF